MGNRVARAAGKKKKAKRVKRRTTAARKRVARPRTKPAKRAGARPGAKQKRVSRRAVKRARPRAKAAAKPPARRATTRPAAKAAARRAPARTGAAPATPAAFAAQRALATAREELLFAIQRARASVKAAIQGLTAASAERPLAPGKWSIKEIVLHLSERDRVRLEEFSRTLGGLSRTWAGIAKAEEDAVNEAHLAPLRAHGWDAAVRRLDSQRELLLIRLSEVPALPDDVWRRGHPFADMMWGLPEHDRHHAAQIKLARIGELLPVEE
jgi:hypothetical protein